MRGWQEGFLVKGRSYFWLRGRFSQRSEISSGVPASDCGLAYACSITSTSFVIRVLLIADRAGRRMYGQSPTSGMDEGH